MRARILIGLIVSLATGMVSAAETHPWIEALASPSLDVERATPVRELQLEMADGLLFVDEGWIFPFAAIDGHVAEYVLIGDATFYLIPPDDVEAHQLELFAGRDDLELSVDAAILVLGRDPLGDRAPRADGAPTDAATALFDDWKDSAEREVLGVETAALRIFHEDPAFANYALLRFTSELSEHPLTFLVDPSESEPLRLGQFVPAELDDVDRHRIERYVRKERRRGRFTGLSAKTLGDWNTWVSGASSAIAAPYGFDIEHHAIDVTVEPGEERIRGTSTMTGVSRSDGLQVVTLGLYSRLVVDSVEDGDGNALPFVNNSGIVDIVLPRPVAAGEPLEIRMGYHGVALYKIEQGIFSQIDTSGWYPDEIDTDRATFDLTLRWPKRYDLLASGKVVEQGVEGNERWQRTRLDVPAGFVSFEVGAFDIRKFDAGDVEVTLAISKTSLPWERIARQHIVETIENALPFYEQTFGEYPLDHLTVVTLPRPYSQGFLGFVTLSHFLLQRSRTVNIDTHEYTPRIETIAHELAHQWWGNKVGWVSYRDQWLSEALADYSAVLYVASQQDSKALYIRQYARGWKASLNDRMAGGELRAALGPVTLGRRLIENHGGRTYSSIVYEKGAVVFMMMARMLQVDPFNRMLGTLADRVDGRLISTETFLRSLEHMSGADLSRFADQFIYGTGIPEIYYSADFYEREDGVYLVKGLARQVAPVNRKFRIERVDGVWSVIGEQAESVDIEERALIVPWQVQLDRDISDDEWTTRGYGGQLLIEGAMTPFSIELPEKPRYFHLDQRGEVLAYFYRQDDWPRRAQHYLSLELSGIDAEAGLLEALALPFAGPGGEEFFSSKREFEQAERYRDAVIYLDLTEHYLRTDQLGKAKEALDEAESRFRKFDFNYSLTSRRVCKAWIDVLEGEYASAYDYLSDLLYLSFPRLETDTVADARRRKKFRQGRRWSGDAYALLAIAAHETGNDAVAERALAMAETRGVDVEALKTVRVAALPDG